MVFSVLGISDHVVVSVSIDSPSNSKQDAPFLRIAYDYSCADWDCLCDHLRDITWKDIFKFSVSAAVCGFCERVHVGISVYFSHCKYQVMLITNLHGFQLLVLLPWLIKIAFFFCTNRINL